MARTYKVGEVAKLAGTTVRALHHYDRIGLLEPSGRSASGYRLYSIEDLLRLQQIHIGRTLGMTLAQVREMLDDPAFDRRRALVRQRAQIVERVAQAQAMLRAIDVALDALEPPGTDSSHGRQTMHDNQDPQDLFDGFDPSAFEDEARARWGKTDAFAESARRTAKYTGEDWSRMKAEEREIMSGFAEALRAGLAPTDDAAVALAERHRAHIDRWFYPCSRTMHAGLAGMYVSDDRFAAAFEAHAEGMTSFVAAAIEANGARSEPVGDD